MVFHPLVFPIMTCFALEFEISNMLYVGPCMLGSFFLAPQDIRSEQSGTLVKEQGSHELDIRLWGT